MPLRSRRMSSRLPLRSAIMARKLLLEHMSLTLYGVKTRQHRGSRAIPRGLSQIFGPRTA
jgi:hypothetical protein